MRIPQPWSEIRSWTFDLIAGVFLGMGGCFTHFIMIAEPRFSLLVSGLCAIGFGLLLGLVIFLSQDEILPVGFRLSLGILLGCFTGILPTKELWNGELNFTLSKVAINCLIVGISIIVGIIIALVPEIIRKNRERRAKCPGGQD